MWDVTKDGPRIHIASCKMNKLWASNNQVLPTPDTSCYLAKVTSIISYVCQSTLLVWFLFFLKKWSVLNLNERKKRKGRKDLKTPHKILEFSLESTKKGKERKWHLPFSASPEIPVSGLNSSRSSVKHLVQATEAYEEPSWLFTCHGTEREVIQIGTG